MSFMFCTVVLMKRVRLLIITLISADITHDHTDISLNNSGCNVYYIQQTWCSSEDGARTRKVTAKLHLIKDWLLKASHTCDSKLKTEVQV